MTTRFVEPSVYLIGESMVNSDGLNGYLTHVGAPEWTTDAQSDNERLTEVFSRSCYKSFKPGLNPNVTKVREGNKAHLANILNVDHGCYDGETQVLTKNGWKYWPDVTESDEFATRTPTGLIEYHFPSKLIQYEYKGRMYRVQGRVDLLVTPEHQLLAHLTTTLRDRRHGVFQLLQAEMVGQKSHRCTMLAEWEGGAAGVPLDILRMIGFFVGDGSGKSGNPKFHLRRKRKILYLTTLCKRLEWEIKVHDDVYTIYPPQEIRPLFHQCYAGDGQKIIPRQLLEENKEGLKALLEGLVASDGSISRTGTCYDTTSYRLAGDVQEIALKTGYGSVMLSQKQDTNTYGQRQKWRIIFLTRNTKPGVNKYVGAQTRSSWIEDWEGTVYCAEVPNHTLFIRRNGRVVWSGNSVMEHAWASFMICDISRIFTHELVRHRVGIAISQESLRYVRLEDLRLVLPRIFADDREALIIMDTAVRAAEAAYGHLLVRAVEIQNKSFDDLPFSIKKKYTSAMRRIAPDGIATNIGWSCNMRALRHILQLRTDPSAEEEIRHVFGNLIAPIAMSRWPNLFQDLVSEEIDGYPCIHKVKES